jgi:hypothetical protein
VASDSFQRSVATGNFPNLSQRAFLLIGAMKAGTTSLFHDLIQNPEICMPEKEPSYLTRYDAAHAAAAYRKLFHARSTRSGL